MGGTAAYLQVDSVKLGDGVVTRITLDVLFEGTADRPESGPRKGCGRRPRGGSERANICTYNVTKYMESTGGPEWISSVIAQTSQVLCYSSPHVGACQGIILLLNYTPKVISE